MCRGLGFRVFTGTIKVLMFGFYVVWFSHVIII